MGMEGLLGWRLRTAYVNHDKELLVHGENEIDLDGDDVK